MKLRLPLHLLAALILSNAVVHAAKEKDCSHDNTVLATTHTITESKDYGDLIVYISDWNNPPTVTIGQLGSTSGPTIKAVGMYVGRATTEMLSGRIELGTFTYNLWGEKPCSLWIGNEDTKNTDYKSFLNVRGGEIIAENRIWLGRWNERAELNLYGGLVQTSGIFGFCLNDAADNPICAVNLLGGKLVLGKDGIATNSRVSEAVPSIFKLNLHKGTLGSYESWSSTRDVTISLDSPGAVLPDGTTSNGQGSVIIDVAKDTTITLNSKIEGTGTGEFIKSGAGVLYIETGAVANTFTQKFVLAGGTLKAGYNIDSVGTSKTVTVRGDGSTAEMAFEAANVSGGATGWRACLLNFDIMEGSTLVFKRNAEYPANILQMNTNTVSAQGTARFEGSVVFDGIDPANTEPEKFVVGAKGKVIAEDIFYFTQNMKATVSGTFTANRGRAQDGSIQVGLAIGAYHGTMWHISKMDIEDGGLLEVKDSKVTLSKSKESGQLNINAGGKADVWGIADTGAWAQVAVRGGTLKVGAGGIYFQDWKQDDGSAKVGDSYLGNVFFSSGKLEIAEDSFYRYTGAKEFAEILNEDGTVRRATSVYSGHFIFGKDNTGVLDDPESRREIQVEEGATFAFEANILGDGGFNKTGKGAVALLVANGYKGNTVVEAGALYLGDDAALGATGKLVLLSGAELAAQGKSVSASNAVEMGTAADSAFRVTLGKNGQTDSLTLSGKVDLLATGATLNVLSDAVFSGDVSSSSATLLKEGSGTLSFTGSLTGVQSMEIQAGKVVFGAEAALSNMQSFKVSVGGGVDLGNYASSAAVDFAGAGSFDHAASYTGKLHLGTAGTKETSGNPWTVTAQGDMKAGSLALNTQNARLTVTGGGFSAESVTFTLGHYNATFGEDQVRTLITADSAAVTGTKKGSITLNFDTDYLHTFMGQGGTFQLFSTGVQYNYGIIRNSQKQLVSVDASLLEETGRITWSKLGLESTLIGQSDADAISSEHPYCPDNEFLYLGAKAGTEVVIASDAVYELDHEIENYSYKFTPGQGSLIFKAKLTGEGHSLYVADYADITEKAEDHSTGYVAISNNANDFAGGANVSGSTLVVDLSLDGGQVLSGENGSLKVNALGTGLVEAVSGWEGIGAVICLRSYGEGKAEGISRYVYANEFSLAGGSTLMQDGANDQVLTGDIRSVAGSNIISNMSGNILTLKGNVTHEGEAALNLHNEMSKGLISLDGSDGKAGGKGRTLEAEYLNVGGRGTVSVTNEYTVKAKGVTINEGSLVIGRAGTLTMGQNGVTGTGTLYLNGGTLKSSSSWNADVKITLGTETNTISTGGANVRLNQGVTGEGGFDKQGTGHLYVYNNTAGNARGSIHVKQGRLILQGLYQGAAPARMAGDPASEYTLGGDLILESGKGASLEGMINANGHNVTFGEGTHFYLGVSEASGLTGYVRNAGNMTIGTGTQLHVNVLQDDWMTGQTYSVFSANGSLTGAENLNLTLDSEFAFVDVSLDLSKDKEVGLYLTAKGSQATGGLANDGTNKGEIHAVVAPLVAGVLDNSTELTGKLHKHMQTISKMTTGEYQTYLTDMGNSASSYYTALSAQVQDATQHINSVRNRVELLNPVLYDDWAEGGIYNVWAGGINHYRDVKSGSEAPGYEMTSWGGELGCAIPLSQTFMIGIGFAYTFADVQVKDGWGSNDNDTYNVDVFARYRKDALTITGVLTGGFTNTEFHRNQLLKDEYTRSNSSTDGNQFMGTIEAGYDFYLNEEKSWILQPLVNLTAGRAKLDSLSETGELKNAGLIIGSQSYNMFSAGIGAKIAYQYKNSVSDQPGRVELKAMYVNDMGDVDFKVNGRFIGAPGNGFDLNGVSNERSAAIVSAGWIAPISAFGQFFVDAGCEFRKDQNGVNTTAGFSFQF